MHDPVKYATATETRSAVGSEAESEPGAVGSHAAIRAEGLVRRFGPHLAVDGIDLEVRPGEIYGFLGPNGAGKSTVVRMLCTLLAPSQGSARVAGHDVVREPQAVRIRIGVALQDAALDDTQTGRELLRLQGRLFGLTRGQISQRMADVLGLVDIGNAIDRRVGTYSGGMKRRLDLAMALIHNPEVLFLDEPTTGLDPASRATVWEEVERLNRDLGMTIFLTTQYLEEADVLAHRVGIINRGRLVAEGSPEMLKRSIANDLLTAEVAGHTDADLLARLTRLPGVCSVAREGDRVTILAVDGPGVLSPVAVILSGGNLQVRSITMRTPSLDDVFLALTDDGIEGAA
jgi:ABC-2 type transport system ATP-binding protein